MTELTTRASRFLSGLGLYGESEGREFGGKIVLAVAAIYIVSFALFYPQGVTTIDESEYLAQTRLLLSAESTVRVVDPLTGDSTELLPSRRALGVPLLLAPFVWAAGWKAAFVVPLLCLVGALLIATLWLRDEGRPQVFALLLMGFPASLVMGRVLMSDVPSLLISTLGYWLFWRGIKGGSGWWWGAGFVAGASWTFRASNPVLFVPLFAGALLRRDRNVWALVVGGFLGLGVRFLTMYAYFGNALNERAGYVFAFDTLMERLPIYLLAVLVFVPGGLVIASLYRGPRRIEVIASVWLFFLLYLFQTWSTSGTSFEKRLVLGLRYLIPVLPIMVFAMAEPIPRLWKQFVEAGSERLRSKRVVAGAWFVGFWIGGVSLATLFVHPVLSSWTMTQMDIKNTIVSYVDADAVLVTNRDATKKFIPQLDRVYQTLHPRNLSQRDVSTLRRRHDEFFIAILDRSDSELWRKKAASNAEFVSAIEPPPELLFDKLFTRTDRLRIWRVSRESDQDRS